MGSVRRIRVKFEQTPELLAKLKALELALVVDFFYLSG